MLFSARDNVLHTYPGAKQTALYTVPANISEINSYAFYGNKFLTGLNLNGVHTVYEYAIDGCENLLDISSQKLSYAHGVAVSGVPWLERQSGDRLELGKVLFRYRGNVRNLELNGYTSIAESAFMDNKAIESVKVGKETEYLEPFVFYGCDYLNEIYLLNANQAVYAMELSLGEPREDKSIYVAARRLYDYEANRHCDGYNVLAAKTTVTLDGMGAAEFPKTVEMEYYGEKHLPIPDRAGYRFDGWYTAVVDNKVSGDKITYDYWQCTDKTKTLYAGWTAFAYSALLVSQGTVEGVVNDKIYYNVEDEVVLPVSEKKHYQFDGWYLNREGTGDKISKIEKGTNKSLVLFAKFSPIVCNVDFDLGYAEGEEISPIEIYPGDEVFTFPVPKPREGYEFNGWMKDRILFSNSYGQLNQPWLVSGNVTLTANWSKERYVVEIIHKETVMWLVENGLSDTMDTIAYGTPILGNEELINIFNTNADSFGEGQTVMHFSPVQNGSDSFNFWKVIPDLGTNGGTYTVYTSYETKGFYLQFKDYPHLNGVYKFGHNLPKPIKKGSEFDGWKVRGKEFNPTLDDAFFADDLLFSTVPDFTKNKADSGLTVYLEPQFTLIKYVVTFTSDHTHFTMPDAEIITYGEKKRLPVPTLVGFRFKGWYIMEAGVKKYYTDGSGNMIIPWDRDEDTVLKCDAEKITYSINYTMNGGSEIADSPLPRTYTYVDFYCGDAEIRLPGITRGEEYRFMGWFNNPGFTGMRVEKIAFESTGDLNLYAKFIKLKIATLELNNGSPDIKIYYMDGEIRLLPYVVRPGYFGEWVSKSGVQKYPINNEGTRVQFYNNTNFYIDWRECTIDELLNYATNTYEIYTYNQLKQINELNVYSYFPGVGPARGITGKFILKSDITAAGDWITVPGLFAGYFNGNNYKISNLLIKVNSAGNYGFFENVYSNGQVSNLTFYNIEIGSAVSFSGAAYVGAVCAYNNNGLISNVYVKNGDIMHRGDMISKVGAIAGVNYGTISSCFNDGTYITAAGYVGGITGFSTGTIQFCVSRGSFINGTGKVGGITAYNSGRVQSSTNECAINYYYRDSNEAAGGIVGRNDGNVVGCYNYAAIKYCSASSDSITLAPYIGGVIGIQGKNGSWSGISYYNTIDMGHLKEVKHGFMWLKTHNQKQNVHVLIGFTET